MPPARTEDAWLAAGEMIIRLYREELGREIDMPALAGWLFHWREDGRDEAFIRGAIRGSDEWRQVHQGGLPPPGAPNVPGPSGPPPDPPLTSPGGRGGLVEPIEAAVARPRYTAAEMATFLPTRGPFLFPAPYGTMGVRLTNATDGTVRPVGMSYWPNINRHAGRQELNVLLSLDDQLTIFAVDKTSGAVRNLGPIPFRATGEGCFWSLSDPDALYVGDGASLTRYNVASGSTRRVAEPAAQCHASFSGSRISCTSDGAAAVFDGLVRRFPRDGVYDECQLDKSGRWLLIKIGNDNTIIDLDTAGAEWTIANAAGAVGHSDMGFGYVVGEDDYAPVPGAFRLWLFGDAGPVDGGLVYRMHGWDAMTRYVSHCNARPENPIGQRVLFSSAIDADLPRANELVTVRMGDATCCVVCPNLTDLTATGGGLDPYWRKPRANLDPLGEWACWTANCGTDRLDAFLVRLPS